MSQPPNGSDPIYRSHDWPSSQAGPNDPTVLKSPYGPGSSIPPPPPLFPSFDPYTPPPKKWTTRMVFITVIVVLLIVVSVLSMLLYHSTTASTMSSLASSTSTPTPPSQVSTATAPTTQYPFSSQLVLDDHLNNASHVASYGWGVATNSNGGCAFTDGAYEVTTHQQTSLYCPANQASFSNFTYEVQMTIKTGGMEAMGGVIFRHQLGVGKNYMFLLGTDGSYALDVSTDYGSSSPLSSGMISGFATGFNRVHTIGIVAKGSAISAYVDQQVITQVSDPTYTSGVIGMVSHYGTSSTTVAFTDAKVWLL